MERKIGEIFEYNGDWYQCVNQNGCCNCAFYNTPCYSIDELSCNSLNKKRKEKYIFKKLEKVGEPFQTFDKYKGHIFVQEYKMFTSPCPNGIFCQVNYEKGTIVIEIKQTNKEDGRKL